MHALILLERTKHYSNTIFPGMQAVKR
uniref:Uncharacterized protein n=1 Tax=Anguilla anguilla TaxID=7936 RepID=A0A0E9R3N4_ANGAN